MTTSCYRWYHIFVAVADRFPTFGERHRMYSGPDGIVFRTAVPFSRGYLFRQMFAVLPDGRIFGPRNRQVDESVLVAWFNDPSGFNDIL